MGNLRKNDNPDQGQGQGQGRGRPEQHAAAISRADQPQLVRDPFQLMRRDPFSLMREMMIDPWRFMQQMGSWGDLAGREGGRDLVWNPSFEVRETDDAFVFKGDMPGVRQDDLDIALHGNNLQITGKREREHARDEGMLHTYERSYGQFSRSFVLPETADLDKVSCDLKDGVLTLVVPKKEGSAPHRRKIEIGSGSKS